MTRELRAVDASSRRTAIRLEVIHLYHRGGEALRETLEKAFPGRELVILERAEQFVEELPKIEAVLVLRPPRGHWAGTRRLRLVQMVGAGVDSVLPAEDFPKSAILANARGIAAPHMAEFILAQMLALAKGLPRARDQQSRRLWRRWTPQSLVGKTVLILGLGAIGQALVDRLVPFGVRILGTQQNPKRYPGVEAVLPPERTSAALEEADWVIVLLPLTPSTASLLGAAALDRMKPGAYLVDVARGGIVDEGALLERLESGRLGGAALDVFEREPLGEDSPLWSARDLLVTPHIAGGFPTYYEAVFDLFAQNVGRLERGEAILNRIDIGRGY